MSKKIWSTIRRMKETLMMWRICRILYRDAPIWSDQISRLRVTQQMKTQGLDKKYNIDTLQLLVSEQVTADMIDNLGSPLWVKRKTIIVAYFKKYLKKVQIQDLYSPDEHKNARCQFRLVDDVISSCIEAKYIEKNTDDDKLISLRPLGRKFADPTRVGLINAWIHDLGPFRTVAISVILAIAGWNWKHIFGAINNLFQQLLSIIVV